MTGEIHHHIMLKLNKDMQQAGCKILEPCVYLCVCGKQQRSLLKPLDVVRATNMIAKTWRDTSATIIQNCFQLQTPCSGP